MGSNIDNANLTQSAQSYRTRSIRNKVKECSAERNDSSVSSKTIHDTCHTVLTNTIPDISTSPGTEFGRRWLEVGGLLGTSKIRTGKISRTTDHLGNNGIELLEDGLGQLAGSNSGIRGLISNGELAPPHFDTSRGPYVGRDFSHPSGSFPANLLARSSPSLVYSALYLAKS